MKRLLGLAALLAALVATSGAGADTTPAPLRYGAADDWPQYHPCGDVWWQSAKDIGLQDVRMTVKWDALAPTSIPNLAGLHAAVDCALLAGMRPILAVYPLHPSAIGSDETAQEQFASFVALVGTAFPGVRDFIVGNEPNVNRFWQPQYVDGADAAATDYEHTLADSYDALKAVRPDSIVWGPAISSRGNDNPNAVSNPSHSPVWFIKYMGDAYRASGRTKPIFDVFDLHPYPTVQDTAPFTAPFRWPQAGAADLDRLKQALWDAFAKTGQPVVTQQPGAYSLPFALDEAGEQTTVGTHGAAYTDAPENIRPIDEYTQASAYADLAELAACDPSVRTVLYFPLIDDPGLADGYQSGELYADLTHKLSYDALKDKIASAHGHCQGGVDGVLHNVWRHTTHVIGAAGSFGNPTPSLLLQLHRTSGVPSLQTGVTANEQATFTAILRKLGGGPVGVPLTGTVRAYAGRTLRFPSALRPGRYRITIVLRAATNGNRTTTLVSKPFTVKQPRP